MTRKRKESFFKVGSMYQWNPNKVSLYDGDGFRVYKHHRKTDIYTIVDFIQPEEIVFISETGKYDKGICYCKILTKNGSIGYIHVDDSFLSHWEQVST